MSEAQKPVEETSAAVPAAEPAKDTPAADATPVIETPAETPAPATTEPAADASAAVEEPAKEEPKAEIKPASEGVLGYKAPGLVKGFRFSKRFCWFSDDAVEVKQLTAYFQNEKLSVAHPTAAWATQTGKGLLFFAKRAEDKAAPTGIINLANISEVTKESGNEFHFKLAGHKHTFQAASIDERASWVAALEVKAAEAKSEKETITSSEGYKAELEKMTKPPVLAAAPKKSLEKKEPVKEDEEETKEEKKEEEKKEEKKPEQKEKSRSQSRKRASIFGNFLAKKDEEKKEDKKEEKAEAKDDKKDEPEAAAPVAETAAPVETAEVPAATTEEPKAEEKKPEAKPEPSAAKAKRASIFGNIFQKVGNQDKAEKESAPKNTETPVSSTAPQLGDPVDASTSEPIKPETVTAAAEPAPAAKETEEPVTSPTSTKSGFLNFIKKEMKHDDKKEAVKSEDKPEKKPEETPAEPAATETTTPPAVKEKRRTSLFGNLGSKKEKKPEIATDGEQAGDESKSGSTSPLPKFGGVFRRVSKAGKKDKEPAATTSESEPIPEAAEKPEPISKDAPTEPAAAVNGTEPSEGKTDAAVPTASSSQPVQAAA
ncbi:hypothetical protein AJ78_02518 [Emergomyces pasteurianus Ep9510]|uniref:PH domain-containing protein n=1 Tax=Emergomyces pasteurianus Ep9510 TaxID=1447872 RepID=A0A1J9QNF0_9EURO|nr:hypothetical protein AJ78_02518 [Emergomyces pasteurianus Ep9510]